MLYFIFFFTSLILTAQSQIINDSIVKLEEVKLIYSASDNTPVTFHNINSQDIIRQSIGQEPALLFANTPSIIAHSDGGHTQGYSYFRLRGIDQTRINITFNGVPLNDPADHAFYFSNLIFIVRVINF